MHGNIKKLPNGYKTRFFNDILSETLDFISICKSKNVVPGGIHLEMTGLDVTECVGFNVNEDDITKNYTTLCDPRLNRLQTIELISQVAKVL
jgi:3-deoxy-7-phosphoheptulonate synthase